MFWAHAISRQDGGDADGVHLLWAPPRWAGYSVDGFDIWRRRSRPRQGYQCYELTRGDLTALATGLRAATPLARIALRLGPCPGPPQTLPDEPWEGNPPPMGGEDERGWTARPSAQLGEQLAAAEPGFVPPAAAWAALLDAQPARAVRAVLALGAGTYDRVTFSLGRAGATGGTGTGGASVTPDAPEVVAPQVPPVFPGVPRQCLVYEFRLHRPCHAVRIRFSPYGGLAVAFRDGKAVDAQAMAQSASHAEVEFHREGIERVAVWVTLAPRAIRICCVSRLDEPRSGWRGARLVARNLQLPLREVEPSVSDLAGEEALARSRLLIGEALGPGRFRDLSEAMNEALQRPGVSPVHLARMTRGAQDQPYVEVQPWASGLALTIDAPWRRALGFGFLDRGNRLVSGGVYDYRVVGRFRRRDLEERLLGFHSVPLGTPLPRVVHLGGVRLDFGGRREVVAYPSVPGAGLAHGFRKGVQLEGRTTLGFSVPLERVVLELEPAAAPALDYRALSGGLIPGLPALVASGPVTAESRVELSFPQPVTRLELDGRGLLYGIRLQLVPPGVDPEEVVELEAVVPGVRYEPTPPPDPPIVLGTANLQEPLLTGDPAETTRRPPNLIGFKLHWLAPAGSSSWPPGWWPPDLPAAPPMEVVGFAIERRRVDTGEGWRPFDTDPEGGLDTLVGAARSGRRDPQPLRPGDELLEHFPDVATPTPPVPVLASLEDVLLSRARPHGPPPGSLLQYRIHSVDAIGRRSATATMGSVVRLEKRLPPPRPPGPPTRLPPPRPRPPGPLIPPAETRPVPRGVRARLLQAADPGLSAEDLARLGGHANAVLIEWGWTDEERRADPWAQEFRLYWQPNPPDLIRGETLGAAVWTGSWFEIRARLSHAVTADQFKGEYLRAGGHPFRVAGHAAGAAGSAILFQLEPSALDITPPPVPGPGRFRLRPRLSGQELQPGSWQERTQVIPIASRTAYEWVFPHEVTLDADHPRVRLWVGVSAADGQPYVADVLPASAINGGRPGNESSIVPAIAEGRWLGRPTLNVSPPLPAVPETMIPEVSGQEVTHEIDLPALAPVVPHPPGSRFRLERLSGADLVATLSADADNSIHVALPDGSSATYALANPADRAALLAQIRSGEPARIDNRFLMDLAIQLNATTLARLWQPAQPLPVGFAKITDRVPNKAERYLYRLRAVDAAGHVSQGAAFLPSVFRVPSRRMPAVPQWVRLAADDDRAQAVLRAGARFDLAGVLLFWLAEDAATADPARLDKPQLLRIPNRPDLYPYHGIRLRLRDGVLLAPSFAAASAASAAGSLLTWTVAHTSGYGRRIIAWAATVTRDGMPSAVAGPLSTATAPAPPAVPNLAVTAVGGEDRASWAAPAADVSVRLERSVDGGASWAAGSPWLPARITSHALPAGPAGRRYRLRARRGMHQAVGPPVTPA